MTLVSWGAMIKETLAAADTLADEGISAEVIGRRPPSSLWTPAPSSNRWTRPAVLVIVPGGGAHRRLSPPRSPPRSAEFGLLSLQAPIGRVSGYDTVVPLPRLEHDYMPDEARILAAARTIVAFA